MRRSVVLSFCVQDKNGVPIPSPTQLSPQVTQREAALFNFFKWKKLSGDLGR